MLIIWSLPLRLWMHRWRPFFWKCYFPPSVRSPGCRPHLGWHHCGAVPLPGWLLGRGPTWQPCLTLASGLLCSLNLWSSITDLCIYLSFVFLGKEGTRFVPCSLPAPRTGMALSDHSPNTWICYSSPRLPGKPADFASWLTVLCV